ncbi:hypothetical protein [Bacteroides nordii]
MKLDTSGNNNWFGYYFRRKSEQKLLAITIRVGKIWWNKRGELRREK